WNEVTQLFRAGMPLRKHRIHFKSYRSCFTASEAVDWLHDLLKNDSNFGPEVTRQQTVQLLRKFLKNRVIEDIKGRWGSEALEDNSRLYRFPQTSPHKEILIRPALSRSNIIENGSKDKDGVFSSNLFRKTPKKHEASGFKENLGILSKGEATTDLEQEAIHSREITQADIEDIWRNITLIHLQKILGFPSLEGILSPSQVNSQHIVYNMTNVSKHGVVTLQDKSGDLPHWVLSAMKCLANWPRSNDLNQPAYVGFERDVLKTVADYFISIPEPLLTFEYYELFVNILVVCGYVMVSNKQNAKRKLQDDPCGPQPAKAPNLNNVNSFKSTECLLLSLVCKKAVEENKFPSESWQQEESQVFHDKGCPRRTQQYISGCRRASGNDRLGGSCQNLSYLKDNHVRSLKFRPRCYSLEGGIDGGSEVPSKERTEHSSELDLAVFKDDEHFLQARYEAELMLNLCSKDCVPKKLDPVSSCLSEWSVADQKVCNEQSKSKYLCRSRSFGGCVGLDQHKMAARAESCISINAPVVEITVKPGSSAYLGVKKQCDTSLAPALDNDAVASDCIVARRWGQSTMELSENTSHSNSSLSTSVQNFSGAQSLLQPHLERLAIEALQLCCLLLPPPSRRRLQLLMRMMSRISQNVDMPRLHDAMGNRTLMVQTFSRCVLCCVEEVDLDELLATRLVSFLMDHHGDILQVPVYLQNAVQDQINYLKKVKVKYPGVEASSLVPAYSFCRQISTQEFEEQRVSTSQAAIAELLESIIKDKNLSVKDKKKKLKQFQKEYPEIYHRRFPNTESEVKLFADKPKIKPPMLMLKKKATIWSLRY
uniref:DEP domain containing 1 n=1 Tax=Latimeria chalumnae TaxID=7897 RepID=H2ZRR0_LATCH